MVLSGVFLLVKRTEGVGHGDDLGVQDRRTDAHTNELPTAQRAGDGGLATFFLADVWAFIQQTFFSHYSLLDLVFATEF